MLEVCQVLGGARYAREESTREQAKDSRCTPRTHRSVTASHHSETKRHQRAQTSGSFSLPPPRVPSQSYVLFPTGSRKRHSNSNSEAQVILRIDLCRTLRTSVRALHADSAGRRGGRPAFGFGLGLAVLLFGVGIGVRDGVERRREVSVLGFVVRVQMCTAGWRSCLSVPIGLFSTLNMSVRPREEIEIESVARN
jgi:hypothetical protein